MLGTNKIMCHINGVTAIYYLKSVFVNIDEYSVYIVKRFLFNAYILLDIINYIIVLPKFINYYRAIRFKCIIKNKNYCKLHNTYLLSS